MSGIIDMLKHWMLHDKFCSWFLKM